MTSNETLILLGIIKTAYPEFNRNLSRDSADNTVSLWSDMLSVYPFELCLYAVKSIIADSKFAPKISEVIERIHDLYRSDCTVDDAWHILRSAASNASVLSHDDFLNLPFEVRRFCGNLSGLRDLAMLNSDTFNSITRASFFKLFDSFRRSHLDSLYLPSNIRQLLDNLSSPPSPIL